MPILFADLKDAVRHTLGGDPAPGASYARIINGAGRAWTASHGWYYLANREATLTATAGDEWVALPSDYLSMHAIVADGDAFGTVQVVTQRELIEAREAAVLGSVIYYLAAFVQRSVSGVIAPYMRLYPAPSGAATFHLVYDATWGDVNEDTDTIPIPAYAEHAFEEWVRLYARGVDEEDSGALAARLAAFRISPMFIDVARTDALTVGATMSPGPGAAQTARGGYVRWNHPNNVT